MYNNILGFINNHIILSGIGFGLILTILARIISNKKLENWGNAIGKYSGKIIEKLGKVLCFAGKRTSFLFRLKFGKKQGESLETFIENSIIIIVKAVYNSYKIIIPINTIQYLWLCFTVQGTDVDDNNGNK